jgi:hypothetical protein
MVRSLPKVENPKIDKLAEPNPYHKIARFKFPDIRAQANYTRHDTSAPVAWAQKLSVPRRKNPRFKLGDPLIVKDIKRK